MAQTIDIEEMLQLRDKTPVVDVRTPAEFEMAHIPEAVNIPLFSNEERVEIGTLYKQNGKNKAVMRGLEFVGPKLHDLAKAGKNTARNSDLIVHCWRGGMRSQSMAWLFETVGLKIKLISGGYKSYRRWAQSWFRKNWQFVVLSGYTGSGKTAILHELKKMGEQVIDLEGLAHHKGSSFGALGQEEQPSTEMFENKLAEDLSKMDLSKSVWIEDESRMVGHVAVPDILFQKMRNTRVIRILEPQEIRLNRLVDEYAVFDKSLLRAATKRIAKRLGGLQYKNAIEALENNDFKSVAEITLKYYDKAYLFGLEKRNPAYITEVHCPHGDAAENAVIALKSLQEN